MIPKYIPSGEWLPFNLFNNSTYAGEPVFMTSKNCEFPDMNEGFYARDKDGNWYDKDGSWLIEPTHFKQTHVVIDKKAATKNDLLEKARRAVETLRFYGENKCATALEIAAKELEYWPIPGFYHCDGLFTPFNFTYIPKVGQLFNGFEVIRVAFMPVDGVEIMRVYCASDPHFKKAYAEGRSE